MLNIKIRGASGCCRAWPLEDLAPGTHIKDTLRRKAASERSIQQHGSNTVRELSNSFPDSYMSTVRRYRAGVTILLLQGLVLNSRSTTVYVNFAESCLQAFVTIPISPFFNSENFSFTCII